VPASIDLDRDIRFAIDHRRLCRVTYDGRTRVCEPHDYGLINHQPKLLAYQRREIGSARPSGWRLFVLDKVTTLIVLDDTFEGSRDVSQDHRKFQWDPLICRVT
jgi:hypothetical protein